MARSPYTVFSSFMARSDILVFFFIMARSPYMVFSVVLARFRLFICLLVFSRHMARSALLIFSFTMARSSFSSPHQQDDNPVILGSAVFFSNTKMIFLRKKLLCHSIVSLNSKRRWI